MDESDFFAPHASLRQLGDEMWLTLGSQADRREADPTDDVVVIGIYGFARFYEASCASACNKHPFPSGRYRSAPIVKEHLHYSVFLQAGHSH